MSTKNTFEDKLFSIRAVSTPMIMVIIAYSIKSTILFYKEFDFVIDGQPVNHYIRLAAAIIIAIPVARTLLSVSVNSDLLGSKKVLWINIGFPEILFVCSIIMMLGVFGLHEKSWEQLTIGEVIAITFLSFFFAFIEYIFSKLFVKKYNAEKNKESLKEKYNKICSDFHGLALDYERMKKDYTQFKKGYESQNLSITQLQKYKDALKCHCGIQHDTVSRLRNCKHKKE